MQCFQINGIKDAFAYDIYGLNGYRYQKVTKYNIYKRSDLVDLLTLSISTSTPCRLKCVSSYNMADLKRSHYTYCTLNQMAEKTEKNKMAKFFNCSPEELIKIS